MPYNIPTLRQLIASGQLDLESSLDTLLPKFGIEKALNTSVASGVRDLYDHQMWIVRQIIPTTESEDQTIVETAQYEGVIRKLASYAVGPVTLQSSVPVPVDTVLQHKDGRQYTVTSSGSPSAGSVVVRIQAKVAGASGNILAGESLSLVTPVPGVQSTGTCGSISGGADIEPISQVLERLLFRKRNPPSGGAVHDYVAWMRELPGVTRAWCYDAWHGGSTVGIAWVYDDRADILPNATDKTSMQTYLFRHSDPATGVLVGRPGGIEPVDMGIQLKHTDLVITPTPDNAATRAGINKNLISYQSTLSPGQTMLVSKVRTAIGSAVGVENYTLNLSSDVTAQPNQLNVIGGITWPTQ